MSQPVEHIQDSLPPQTSEAERIFRKQKAAWMANPYPGYETRVANLKKLRALVDPAGETPLVAGLEQYVTERCSDLVWGQRQLVEHRYVAAAATDEAVKKISMTQHGSVRLGMHSKIATS